MKLVYLNYDSLFKNVDVNTYYKQHEWKEQFKTLHSKYSTEASSDVDLKPTIAGDSSLLLLVNNDEKVVAGCILHKYGNANSAYLKIIGSEKNEHFRIARQNEWADNKHLPSALGSKNVGYIDHMVADPHAPGVLMPGIELQKQISLAFKDKDRDFADVDVLVANVVDANILSLYQASRDIDLKTVVRSDLTRETNNGKSFFVASTNDQNINLVPAGHEKDVVPDSDLHDQAHKAIIQLKISRTEKKKLGNKEDINPGAGFIGR